MITECIPQQLEFQGLESRRVVVDFSAGQVSSDAGALLLREVDTSQGLLKDFSECFTDHRNPDYIEHSVLGLISQRVYGLCLGYEDLNDHEELTRES